MKQNVILKTTVLFTLFCANALLAQDVKYNYDREANFAVYKTYRWIAQAEGARDPLFDKDVHRAIDEQLSQRGLQKVEANGHLIVRYETALDRERQADLWSMGPRWNGIARANTSTVEIGTLVVTLYDPVAKQVVWRGSVSKTLNPSNDPNKNYKNLEKAVAKLLKNYPPEVKK